MQMKRVKNMIERKQSIATEAKADDFNDAVHHAHHTPTHVHIPFTYIESYQDQ